MFQAAIGFAVSAVPEGLPAILTITLARGVQIMAKRNAVTRKLNSIETLGSVSVICSDKTGTLTANEMTVRAAVTPEHHFTVEGEGYEPEGAIELDGDEVDANDHDDLWALVEAMAVANDSEIESDDDGEWTLTGEPTEGALLTLARKAGFDADEVARTLAVNILVMAQVFYLFNVRSLGSFSLRPSILVANKMAWLSIAVLLVLQLGFVYAPFMHAWFGSAALSWQHWLLSAGIGVAIMAIVEVEKWLIQRVSERNG